mmetsp:Transcript_17641/g.30408  ORF Transcript_17641/g.30408 Transcript_17641/m.30408 type:complete len:417 (-) Transcript_17641:172-1422(-)
MLPRRAPTIILVSICCFAALQDLSRYVFRTSDYDEDAALEAYGAARNLLSTGKSYVRRRKRWVRNLRTKKNEQRSFNAAPPTDASSSAEPASASSQRPGVSLVTSFWAAPPGEPSHAHRLEVKLSLLANMYNPHFDQVVVFLDGVSDESHCAHFLDEMKDLSLIVDGDDEASATGQKDPFAHVACVGVPFDQPTYYQMFRNALSDAVTGEIVVLANADQVFDDTVSLARRLNPDVLILLPTRGTSWTDPETKHIYDSGMAKRRHKSNTKDMCANAAASSFDSWIFHKSKLSGQLNEEHFQRLNKYGEMQFFFMNEYGAEHAALWAVQRGERFSSLYNACEEIRSWHFHLTKKTHKVSDEDTYWLHIEEKEHPLFTRDPKSVPKPWNTPAPGKTAKCTEEGNCFLKNGDVAGVAVKV